MTNTDPTPVIRTEFNRGEQVTGLVWICLGALMSLIFEVVYLGVRIPVGESSVAFPYTILVAFGLNMVFTRTARLWSSHPAVVLAPLVLWLVGFMGLLVAGDLGSVQALGGNIRTVLLLFAGIAGGVWPFFRVK